MKNKILIETSAHDLLSCRQLLILCMKDVERVFLFIILIEVVEHGRRKSK